MEGWRENDKRMLILDRPNPIGGAQVEGPVLDPAFRSFVGLHPLAVRHGMTVGEIAGYLNKEFQIGCRLDVAPMEGWRRSLFFDKTGLPWVMPSPETSKPRNPPRRTRLDPFSEGVVPFRQK